VPSFSAGSAFVSISPDLRGFNREIKRQLREQVRDLSVDVGANLDTSRLQADLAAATRDRTVRVSPQVDTRGFTRQGAAAGGEFARSMRARLQAGLADLPEARIDADTDPAQRRIRELRSQMARLSTRTIGVNLDATAAREKIAKIQSELSRLSAESPNVQVRTDTAAAMRELATFSAEVARTDHQSARVQVQADTRAALGQLSDFGTRLDRLSRRRPSVRVQADTATASAELAMLSNRLARLGTQSPDVTVQVETARATAELHTLQAELSRLAGMSPSVQVRADTARATARIVEVQAELARINGQTATANVRVDDHGSIARAGQGISSLVALGMSLGPALIPIGAALTASFAGIGTAAAAGVGGIGVLALAMHGVGGALQAMSKAHQTAGKSAAQQKAADQQLAQAMAQLPPAARPFVKQLYAMKPALEQLQNTAAKGVFPGLRSGITAMLPLFPSFNRYVGSLAGAMGDLFNKAGHALNSPFWRRFFGYLQATGAPTLKTMGTIIGNVAKGFAGFLMAFKPVSDAIGRGLARMSKQFANWGTGGGVQRFLGYIQRVGPLVVSTLGKLFRAFGHILVALAPIGAIGLVVVRGLSSAILAIPTRVLTVLLGVIIALTGALWVGNLAFKAMVAAQRTWIVLTKAWTIATKIAAAAQWLWNAAMDANPIMIVVIAIAALVAAVIYAYTHFQWFRNIVQACWNSIKTAALVVWNNVLKPVFNAMTVALGFVGRHWRLFASIVAFVIFGPIVGAILYLALHWKQVWHALVAGARAVGAFFTGPFVNFFVGGFRRVRAVVVGWYQAVVGFFTRLWHQTVARVTAMWASVTGAFRRGALLVRVTVVRWVAEIVRFFVNLWQQTVARARAMWTAVSGAFRGGINFVKNLVVGWWHAVVRFFTNLGSQAWGQAKRMWHLVSGAFRGGINFVKNAVIRWWHNVVRFYSQLAVQAWGQAKRMWHLVSNAFLGGLRYTRTIFTNWWHALVRFFSTLASQVWGQARRLWSLVSGAFRGGINYLKGLVGRWGSGLMHFFGIIANRLHAVARHTWDLISRAFKSGVNFVIGIINYFAKAINWVAGKLGFHLNLHVNKLATGGFVNEPESKTVTYTYASRFADGGVLPRGTRPGVDTIPAMSPYGPLMLAGGEFVTNERSTSAIASGVPSAWGAINSVRSASDARALFGGLAAGGKVRGGDGASLPGLAGGGIPAKMTNIVHSKFPGAIMTSGYRPGAHDYHGAGKAADFSFPGNPQSRLEPLAAWLVRNYGGSSLEIIHNPNASVKNGKQVPPSLWGAATWAAHRNHVHWASNLIGKKGILGRIGSFISHALHSLAHHALDPLMNKLKGVGDRFGFPGKMASSAFEQVVNHLFSSADKQDAAASAAGMPGAGKGPVVAQVRKAAAAHGWGSGAEWNALSWLISHESSWNPRAQNPVSTAYGLFQFLNCVPLDSEILTRRGWLTYDQVRPGDETLGYNPETGRTEWTTIRHVVTKDPQEVVRVGNSRWSARVTPGHRWWSQRRHPELVTGDYSTCPECGTKVGKRGPFSGHRALRTHRAKAHGVAPRGVAYTETAGFVRTDELTTAHELVLSAQADTGEGLPISDDQARLLGWLAGDGHISDENVTLYQSKPGRVAEIRELLARLGIETTEHSRERGHRRLRAYQWYFPRSYARELLKRAEWDDGPEHFILACSPQQRAAWLDGMIAAEGTCVPSMHGDVMRIPQNDGPVCDAIVLAAYLEGYRPARRRRQGQSGFTMVTLSRPNVHGSTLDVTEHSVEPVWCVQTDLGTWTMRQDGQVMLTGNSTWGAYGGHKTSNPYQQAVLGTRYIAQRYHDPLGAQRFWRGHHWYSEGGRVGADEPAIVGESGPELFLPGRSGVIFNQTQLRGLAELAGRSDGRGSGRDAGLTLAPEVRVFIGDRELTDMIDVQIEADHEETARALRGGRR
jgi:hypothetical protein